MSEKTISHRVLYTVSVLQSPSGSLSVSAVSAGGKSFSREVELAELHIFCDEDDEASLVLLDAEKMKHQFSKDWTKNHDR